MFNKKVVKSSEYFMDNEEIKIVVLRDKDYYNIHQITERFMNDELNSLALQIPKENVQNEEETFDDAFMLSIMMEYIIWSRYGNVGDPEVIIRKDNT